VGARYGVVHVYCFMSVT